MKKNWYITILVSLLLLAGGWFVISWPRTVPLERCSEIYRIYADKPSIKASYIKDFPVNDTLILDVTLLQATDSNAWAMLFKDFELVIDPALMQRINDGKDLITIKEIPKNHQPPNDSSDIYPNDMAAFSHQTRTITIFHFKTQAEKYAIIRYVYRDII